MRSFETTSLKVSPGVALLGALSCAACLAPPPTNVASPPANAGAKGGICTQQLAASGTTLAEPGWGTLSAESVEQASHAAMPDIVSCYGGAFGENRGLLGHTTLDVLVGPSGVARVVVRQNSFPNCAAVRCARDRFEALRFPAPEGGSALVTLVLGDWINNDPGRALKNEPATQLALAPIGIQIQVHEAAEASALLPSLFRVAARSE
jgi:hypothetical protein